MRANNIVIISILVVLITNCVIADDWPNWRGPHHNGISNETNPGDWAQCQPRIIWQQQVGTGFSSMTVADGRLYTMGNTERIYEVQDGGSRTGVSQKLEELDEVFCIDPDTGAIIWVHAYPSPLTPYLYEGGPSATPTVADGNVYTFSKEGVAYCLDTNDGKAIWQSDLVAEYGVRVPTYGFSGSAYVDANMVVFNAGTHGLALNAADGTLAWQTGTNKAGYSTPVPFDFDGQRYFLLMSERTFAAVHAQTGQTLWEQSWVTRYNANIPDPIVDANLVFVSTGYSEGSALFDVITGQPHQLWFQKNVQIFLNTAVLWQGYLYGPNDKDDTLTCIERDTGRIVWAKSGFGRGSVMLADDKLIALSEDGVLSIAEASPDGYMELAREGILGGKCWTVPVLANGKVYARNAAGQLVCVELWPTGETSNPGLIANWKLDETEGTIAQDSIGRQNGTLYGEPLWQPEKGKVDGAIQLDGIDDYIITPYILSPADGDFSVFVWIKGGAAGQVILSQQNGAYWLMADPVSGALKTELKTPAISGRTPIPPGPPLTSSTIITDGEWHHAGFVRNGRERILYVDVIEVARDTAENLEHSEGNLYIGTSNNKQQGTFFSGLIDDVRLYDNALNPETIASLMQ